MDLFPRPLTVLPLCFFMVGWGLFVAGFGWLLSSSQSGDMPITYYYTTTSRTDPSLYPFYVTLVGGPFIALAGSLHALVTIPILSLILGLIAVKLSVIYFVSAGTVAILCSYNITSSFHPTYYPKEYGSSANVKVVLMLSGTLTQGVCWCIVLMLSVFYKYRPFHEPGVAHSPSTHRRRWPFTPGLGRVLCIPCVILSAIGWCVYTGGVYNLFLRDMFYMMPAFIIPPLAYLTALLHAGCSEGASTVMGVFTAILNMLFLSFMGERLIYNAINLRSEECENIGENYDLHHNECYYDRLILGGGVLCLFFWGCVLALWPFYRNHPSPLNTSSERANRNYSPYGTVQDYSSYRTDTQPLIGHQ